MIRSWLFVVAVWLAASGPICAGEPMVRVEHSKPEKQGRGLGSRFYEPTPLEEAATKAWDENPLEPEADADASLSGRVDQQVAWFGIVREVTEDRAKNETGLFVEMRYFDGLTDLHQQIVSTFGAGDFRVVVPGIGHQLKKLALVKVYGKVVGERDGVPTVAAEFVRSWDWGLFAFMAYGADKGNPAWAKLRNVGEKEDYEIHPDQTYYEKWLGKR